MKDILELKASAKSLEDVLANLKSDDREVSRAAGMNLVACAKDYNLTLAA